LTLRRNGSTRWRQYGKIQDYKDFLSGLGYKVLAKNLNLNMSFGKARWRPFGRGSGQVATSPGGYNKEILIIEKKADGESFDVHTSYDDLIAYYQSIRGMYIMLLSIVIAFWESRFLASIGSIPYALLAIAMVLLLIPIVLYSRRISMYKRLRMTNE